MKNLSVQEKNDLDNIVFNALAKGTSTGLLTRLWERFARLFFKVFWLKFLKF